MKLLKDERIQNYENKVKAEAYNIMMSLAFVYILAEQVFSINLGIIKEFNVFILFLTGALYTTIRLTMKDLGSYSPIKGMHPFTFYMLICATAAVAHGTLMTIRNSRLYLDGQFSYSSIAVFISSAVFVFMITAAFCSIVYLISKKRESKDMEEEPEE